MRRGESASFKEGRCLERGSRRVSRGYGGGIVNPVEVCVSLYVKVASMPMCLFDERGDQEVRLPGVVCAEVKQVAVPLRMPVREE